MCKLSLQVTKEVSPILWSLTKAKMVINGVTMSNDSPILINWSNHVINQGEPADCLKKVCIRPETEYEGPHMNVWWWSHLNTIWCDTAMQQQQHRNSHALRTWRQWKQRQTPNHSSWTMRGEGVEQKGKKEDKDRKLRFTCYLGAALWGWDPSLACTKLLEELWSCTAHFLLSQLTLLSTCSWRSKLWHLHNGYGCIPTAKFDTITHYCDAL